MNEDFSDRVSVSPPTALPARMWRCFARQSARSAICPSTPRLDGQTALITGGSRGVGLETSRGLAARGVDVFCASRGEATGRPVVRAIGDSFAVAAEFLPLDLGDLDSVAAATGELSAKLEGRRLSMLVANAGLWPTRHSVSAQGYEIAFATNVLGHHALIRDLLDRGILAEGARVVIVTGDIYVMARACTADYDYRGLLGGQAAYCRSKLGNLWYARELAHRRPELRVHAVHPGIIASELGGSDSGWVGKLKRSLMLTPEQGAQTSLFCATQPGLKTGTYYHNTLGRVELAPADVGADRDQSADFWALLERLV